MSSKRKMTTTPARPVIKPSAKIPTKSRIDETRVSVSIGKSQKPQQAPAEISNDSSSHHSEDDDSEDEAPTTKLKTTQDGDIEMDGQENGDASDSADAAPTFGDLVRETSTVDVAAALAAEASATAPRSRAQQSTVAPVNAISMGITLDQALRTDDNDLLESCLHISHIETVENTIQRMDSSLAGVLLSKLAARMHRRPGRAYGLMKWVQWTLIAHGGALVGQPEVVKRLGELSRVLEERSRGLNSLLSLKGKLDMLDAQMQLRKNIKKSARKEADDGEESDEDESADVDEPGVVFVEGDGNEIKVLANGTRGGLDDELDDYPIMNGMDGDSDEDSEDDEDFVDEDLADEESMDEDEVDHDDVEDSGEEESDNDDSGPPAKVQKTGSKSRSRK